MRMCHFSQSSLRLEVFSVRLEVHFGSLRDVTEELFGGVHSDHCNGWLRWRRRRQSCRSCVVRLKQWAVSATADAERRDEDVHKEDEVEQVCCTVLPEGTWN